MNQLNKANAKRSTSLKNIKDWLPGRSVYESAASVPWKMRIMGVHENLCQSLCRTQADTAVCYVGKSTSVAKSASAPSQVTCSQ